MLGCTGMFQPGCLGQIVTERDQSTSGGFEFVPNEFLVSDRNISSIEPKLYQERFIHFIKNRVLSKNNNNNSNSNNNSTRNYNNNGSSNRNSNTVGHGRTETNSNGRSSNSGSRRNSSNGLVNGIPVAPLAPLAPSTLVTSSSSSSIPVAVAPVVQQQRMRMYRVVVPNGVAAGSEFTVNAGGRNYSILCPRNGGMVVLVRWWKLQLPA